MSELIKTDHLVEVYYFNKTFFVVGSVELPPIFVWAEVNPVMKIQDLTSEKLASAINSAREVSKSRFDPGHANPEIKPWDGEKGKVWDHATKSWSIWWKEDGSVTFERLEPRGKYKGSFEWKMVSDTEKTFFPSVSLQDIAQEILKQLQV